MDYITEETLNWIASSDDPVARYLVIKEFPGFFQTGLADISSVKESPRIKKILASAVNGVAGDSGRYDLWYRGSVWAFAELVQSGLTVEDPCVSATAEYIVSHALMSSGGFSMNWAPPREAAGWTGDILYYLLLSGYRNDAIHRSAEWIVSKQRTDGGWSHAPISGIRDALALTLFRKSGSASEKTGESTLLSTVSCGRALALYNTITGKFGENISMAADFVLTRKRLLKNRQTGGELYMSNRHFRSLGYPILCQQDILSSLLFIAGAGKLSDKRASEAFNIVMSKRLKNGRFLCESSEQGTIHAKYGRNKKESDKYVTLQALRLMKFVQPL